MFVKAVSAWDDELVYSFALCQAIGYTYATPETFYYHRLLVNKTN